MLALRRLGAGLALAILLTAVPVFAQEKEAGPPFDKLLPNDTEMVFVVKVRAILESKLVKDAGLTGAAKELLGSVEEVQDILKELNFDPLKDVDQVTVAVCSGSDTDKGLIIIRGSFDLPKLRARGEQAAKDGLVTIHKAPGGHTLYEFAAPGAGPMFGALASETTLLLAPSKDYILDALDKEAGTRKTQLKNKQVAELLGRLDPKLMVAVAIPGSTLSQSPLLEGEVKEVVDKIQDIVAGVVIGKDIEAYLAVTTKKASDAKMVDDLLTEGLDMATVIVTALAQQNKDFRPLLNVVKSVRPSIKDKTIIVEVTVRGETIEKMLKLIKP